MGSVGKQIACATRRCLRGRSCRQAAGAVAGYHRVVRKAEAYATEATGLHRAVRLHGAVRWRRAVRGHKPLAQKPQGGTCRQVNQRPLAQKPQGGTCRQV